MGQPAKLPGVGRFNDQKSYCLYGLRMKTLSVVAIALAVLSIALSVFLVLSEPAGQGPDDGPEK